MKHKPTSTARRKRTSSRKRTPIAIRRLQGRKRTAEWRIREGLSDPVRYYQTPLRDSEVDELRVDATNDDGTSLTRREFRKLTGLFIRAAVKWAIRKRFTYEELAAILDRMDDEM